MKLVTLAVVANALRVPLRPPTRLQAKNEDDIGKQAKGFYIRPSAAIERGGGFFIPGLEGAKLRIALGGGLLVLSGLSIAASGDAPLAVRVSECVAAFASAGVVLPYVLPSTETEDELAAYRAAQYEDRGRQLKRAAAKVALGVAACSIAMIGLRVKRASS